MKDRAGNRRQKKVVTLLCKKSREAKQQYTKRFLPEHLIWRSPFSSDQLVALMARSPDRGSEFWEQACEALGCTDLRTARKHVARLESCIPQRSAVLVSLGASGSKKSGPLWSPGTCDLSILELLWRFMLVKVKELAGTLASMHFKPLLWTAPGIETWACFLFNQSCTEDALPP